MQPPQRNRVHRKHLLAIVLAVVVAGAWLAWWQWDRVRGWIGGDSAAATPVAGPGTSPGSSSGALEAQVGAESGEPLSPREAAWLSVLGESPAWPEDVREPGTCGDADERLERLCFYLDDRDYVDDAALPGGTCGWLEDAVELLAARPPAMAADLSTRESTLENAFHIYRVLGTKRLRMLRKLLVNERQLAEPIAFAAYRWVIAREGCSGSPPDFSGLYLYSGFLLDTLGGQAYLRRRHPRVEGLATFYALLVLDRAVDEGYNPEGIDPRPEIERTRALFEDSDFVFAARYRAELDAMDRRWQGRSLR